MNLGKFGDKLSEIQVWIFIKTSFACLNIYHTILKFGSNFYKRSMEKKLVYIFLLLTT